MPRQGVGHDPGGAGHIRCRDLMNPNMNLLTFYL
jgi:hypothetical protein